MTSVWKVIQRANPPYASDGTGALDLTPAEQDALVQYQLATPQGLYLDAMSLLAGGVCAQVPVAEKTLQRLQAFGYALPRPGADETPAYSYSPSQRAAAPRSSASSPAFTIPALAVANLPPGVTVNTSFVDANLSPRMVHLSHHAQRRLVGLLFFWEAECRRWQALEDQEADLAAALSAADRSSGAAAHPRHDLRVALEQVRLRKRLLPSQRAAAGEAPPTAAAPVYEEEPPPPYPGLP